jgi:hypothetical protein
MKKDVFLRTGPAFSGFRSLVMIRAIDTVMFHKFLTHGPTYLTAITAYSICKQETRLTLFSSLKL